MSNAIDQLASELQTCLDEYHRSKGKPGYGDYEKLDNNAMELVRELYALRVFVRHCRKDHSLPDICCPDSYLVD